ncbi:MAG: transporter substrate-binding domain-containing protein [Desulfoprunum sp.]|nr:transporter substrate-binding domain-containing protein [Desulfoprunum sp.]
MNKKAIWCTPGLRRFVWILALLSCVILPSATACGAGAEGQAARPIRVVMDNNYPPYVFLDGDGILQGILVDQWRLWQKKTGTPVEIKAIDWGSALKGMKEGDFDVIDTIFKTEERSGWLDFTRPYARLEVPVFFNKEISGISGVESLKGFAVAAKEGDAAVDLLRSHGVENLLLFKGYEEIIRAAKEHKVNVFVVDKPPALYFLYKYGIQGQYKESPPLDVGQFHRAVKKGDKALLQQIEVGFARISTKELQQIEEKWYGSPILRSVRVEYFLAGAGILCLLILSLFFWNRSLRKAVENRTRELQISEERYRQLFNAESDAIVVIDIETLSHVEVNEAAVDLYGYSHDELMALRSTDLSADPEETLRQITGGSGRVRIPLRYHRKKDGTVFPVEIGARFFELNGRNLLLAAMRDISERLQTEESMRENRRFLIDLIENSGTLIFVKDRAGRYELVNRKWEEVTGLQRENVLARTDEELFPGYVGEQFRRNDLDVIESGEVQEKEEVLERENARRYFLSIKFPLRNEKGSITGICGMTTEITERRQAEEERERLRGQLSQSHKMESIGRLAGGIAHDFNNMLGVILGHTELALLRVPSSEQIHSNLKEVEKAARRSADLTRQLLAFARKQTVVPKVLDLNETVTGMLNMLRRLIGEDIDLVWTPTEGLWQIKMDPSQIDQVLANLCANGRDSITNIGRVVISTENANISAAYCTEHEGCAAGEYVMLSVTDNGCGMDRETLALLFEPFYTTKEVGKGTGLGLATVYGIVQQNKGFIKVDSEPGQGTSFKVYLPRYSEPVVNFMQQDVTEPLSFGAGTVLLVEDEPAILEMATQMLEKIGYRVLTAETPSAAIRLAHEHVGRIDLLLTDVIMPEMNGWELSQKILQIQPGMKRLFTSGYTANAIAHHSVLDESLHFIQKPFTMQELSSKVCLAMEREPEGG